MVKFTVQKLSGGGGGGEGGAPSHLRLLFCKIVYLGWSSLKHYTNGEHQWTRVNTNEHE